MNMVQTKCLVCQEETLGSRDEVLAFGGGTCDKHTNEAVVYFKMKILSGFYDLPEVRDQIIDKLIESSFDALKCVEKPSTNLLEHKLAIGAVIIVNDGTAYHNKSDYSILGMVGDEDMINKRLENSVVDMIPEVRDSIAKKILENKCPCGEDDCSLNLVSDHACQIETAHLWDEIKKRTGSAISTESPTEQFTREEWNRLSCAEQLPHIRDILENLKRYDNGHPHNKPTISEK